MLNTFKNKINLINYLSLNTNYRLNHLNNPNTKIQNKSEKEEYNNIIYRPSSSKEWFSSVYSYNKSYVKSLIVFDFITNKLFSSYFNMIRDKIKIIFKRRRDNKSRYSANKVYVSRAEFKHTNTKLFIILSTFNKQRITLLKRTRKTLFIKRMYKILVEYTDRYWVKSKRTFTTLWKSLTDKGRVKKVIRLIKKIIKLKTPIKSKRGIKSIRRIKSTWVLAVERYIPSLVNRLNHKCNYLFKRKFFAYRKWNILFFKKNSSILTNFLLNFKNKKLYNIPIYNRLLLKNNDRVLKRLFKNIRLVSFNKAKFNHLVLHLRNLGLNSLIEKIYGKKVIIKLVDLKSIHLNSDVFSSAVALKLKDRKNKAVRVLRKAILQMVRIPDFHTLITWDDNLETINKNNIVDTIKQQVVTGVRFEASGRLTRRLTAMRSVFKLRYVGSLKNLRSSFNNKASSLLRGYTKANSQYTLINSKTRNGTFGLKGWVSSH